MTSLVRLCLAESAGLAAVSIRRRLVAGLARTVNVPRGGDVDGVGQAGAVARAGFCGVAECGTGEALGGAADGGLIR